MNIGGLEKFSLIDYPGKICAVVFLSGCNFRCGFCHNPQLVDPKLIKEQPVMGEKEALDFLKTRKGKLDGVCITGGEPTVWKDLEKFILKIKSLGLLVKLDTNGTDPKLVEKLLRSGLIDYFAIDIKNSPAKYKKTVGAGVKVGDIEKTLKLIARHNIPLELRTTVVSNLHILEDIEGIKKWLLSLGIADKICLYAIQQFRPGNNLKEEFNSIAAYEEKELQKMADILRTIIKKVEVRGV